MLKSNGTKKPVSGDLDLLLLERTDPIVRRSPGWVIALRGGLERTDDGVQPL